MFGWGKQRTQSELEKLNALNPVCATVYHEMVNELFERPGSLLSYQIAQVSQSAIAPPTSQVNA
jgi:hypothetical protein